MTELIIYQVSGLQQLRRSNKNKYIYIYINWSWNASPPSQPFLGVSNPSKTTHIWPAVRSFSWQKNGTVHEQCHLSLSVWSNFNQPGKQTKMNPSDVASSFAKCSGDSHVRSCVSRTFQRSRFAHLGEVCVVVGTARRPTQVIRWGTMGKQISYVTMYIKWYSQAIKYTKITYNNKSKWIGISNWKKIHSKIISNPQLFQHLTKKLLGRCTSSKRCRENEWKLKLCNLPWGSTGRLAKLVSCFRFAEQFGVLFPRGPNWIAGGKWDDSSVVFLPGLPMNVGHSEFGYDKMIIFNKLICVCVAPNQ